jgi:hypothetical protein
MKKVVISVTEAVRNFADCINRTRYQNITFVLLKNGSPMAQLAPNCVNKNCSGRDLAAALAGMELEESEARNWHRDVVSSRPSS